MNRFSILSLIFFLSAFGCFFLAFLEGNLHVGILFIVPFIIGSGMWSVLGVGFLILSFIFFTYRSFKNIHLPSNSESPYSDYSNLGKPSRHVKGKVSGIIFIGPIPLVFGQDLKSMLLLLILGVIIFIILIVVFSHVFS